MQTVLGTSLGVPNIWGRRIWGERQLSEELDKKSLL
jgi:hypothetical protein